MNKILQKLDFLLLKIQNALPARFASRKYVLLILALIFIATFFALKKDESQNVEYRQSKVERGKINITVLATGTVQPKNRLEIKPPIPGRVEQVLIEEGQEIKKGQILAWMSSTERAALLDAAQAKGKKELEKWEDIYRPTPIIAPISGTLVLKNVENGQSFTSTDAILVMSDHLIVKAQVDETDIASIGLQQKAEIVLDAYPETKTAASVDLIAFEATTVNNVTTYVVDVLPQAVPDFMRSGMTANVTFFIDDKEDVLTIPTNAIKNQDGKTTVLALDDGDEVSKEIVIGISDGKKTEVISGLKEGDIVLSPQIKLRDKNSNSSTSPFAPARGGGRR